MIPTLHRGSEESETTEDICVLLSGVLPAGTTTVTAVITPEETTGANAATGKIYIILWFTVFVCSILILETEDFDPQPMTVILTDTQQEVCVRIAIVADTVDEPNEVFGIRLTSNTTSVPVRPNSDFIEVLISEMGKLII